MNRSFSHSFKQAHPKLTLSATTSGFRTLWKYRTRPTQQAKDLRHSSALNQDCPSEAQTPEPADTQGDMKSFIKLMKKQSEPTVETCRNQASA